MRVAVLAFNTENLQGRNLEERQPRRLFPLLGSRLNKAQEAARLKFSYFLKPMSEHKQKKREVCEEEHPERLEILFHTHE